MINKLNDIQAKLNEIKQSICQNAHASHRNPNTITLLAVSKKQSAQKIKAAHLCGQTAFGENYLQEALEKIQQLQNYKIDWHFIGHIQSNKTREISEHFLWAHTVDREKIAKRLNDQRPASLAPLNVCIQVNIDNQASKSGVSPDKTLELALKIAELPAINLRGLMAIPEANTGPTPFKHMQALLNSLKAHPKLAHLDTLSMGMSQDWQGAVAHGATIIRIGTALFGARD